MLYFWDNFVIDGYLVIFQSAIILLGIFEDKLMSQTFEEMLNYITDIPRVLFSRSDAMSQITDLENLQDFEEEAKEELVEQSPEKKMDIKLVLQDIDFKSLLKGSNITIELLDKIELEYKENEQKGNFREG
jgi:hypothetical protein